MTQAMGNCIPYAYLPGSFFRFEENNLLVTDYLSMRNWILLLLIPNRMFVQPNKSIH
jgi:hypothetical protein